MKTLIFLFILLSRAFGADISRGWREACSKIEVFDCAIPINLQKYSIDERCFMPEVEIKEDEQVNAGPGSEGADSYNI